MHKAQCKGRTLVLKVKLHTFEVYTRQTVVPKAICLADDLYNYALPILAKLEQEAPGMRIRLMGLRCTHLVSTKKPDTLAFFGLKPKSGSATEPGKVLRNTAPDLDTAAAQATGTGLDDDGWQKWPEDLLDGYEIEPDLEDLGATADQELSPRRKHGKEIMPNSVPHKEASPSRDEWWQCPVCSRPQPANEQQFNGHIDTCLSRQAIRDVQKDVIDRSPTPDRRPKAVPEKKRGRPSTSMSDPKQKKLRFG